MTAIPAPDLRRATGADLGPVLDFLSSQALPSAGVRLHLHGFWLACHGGDLIGIAGLEVHGDAGLLRSVAVAPAHRHAGLARALVARVVEDAKARRLGALYLLTETAAPYFARLGFERLARSAAPKALLASEEFRGACPASAVLMRLGNIDRT